MTAPKAEGHPVRPEGLDADEAALWEAVVPWLVDRKIAGASDSAALQAMVEMWGCYRKTMRLMRRAEVAVVEKTLRTAAIHYQAAFERWASRFGLTPADRARLLTAATSAEGNPLQEFGIVG